MRYAIALMIASLLLVGSVAYVRQTYRSIELQFRQSLREARAAGTLPPDVDPERADPANFNVPLPSYLMRRLEIAHFLLAWRFVLIAIVLFGGLGGAHMLGRVTARNRP